jgi:hypothetical protein
MLVTRNTSPNKQRLPRNKQPQERQTIMERGVFGGARLTTKLWIADREGVLPGFSFVVCLHSCVTAGFRSFSQVTMDG